jgi:Tol biopolymer transport system component/DNA-binding winged helix-turn-helix (wHTH) protein
LGAWVIVEKVDRIAFGLFEVDVQAGELWKAGFRVRLQGQPFKVLVTLLAKPGEVVTREELQLQVWGSNTTVDFERALAGAINKIREALGDSAENPRFIETLTKRGYRFIAPVTAIASLSRGVEADALEEAKGLGSHSLSDAPLLSERTYLHPHQESLAATPVRELDWEAVVPERIPAIPSRNAWKMRELILAGIAGALLIVLVIMLWRWRRDVPAPPFRVDRLTRDNQISTGPPNMESLQTFATDGDRILTSIMVDGKSRLSAISISTGEVERLETPEEVASSSLADVSKDGLKLLLRSYSSSESEQPLWVVPSSGGSALRVGNVLAHDASWMPDGSSILYANGNDLAVMRLDDGTSVPYAKLPGRAFWMRWSPDGKLLRFTLMNPLTHTASLWELDSQSKVPRPIQKTQIDHLLTCCGTWTADGSGYVFTAFDNWISNLWELKGGGRSATVIQLTNGPLQYLSPVAARSGSRIFFLGMDEASSLQQFSEDHHEFEPVQSFLADANRVDYSRDGVWVAWTDADGRLWRARAADGSDKVQLTPSYLEVFLAHWSPNGKQLAVMARQRESAWQIYLVDAAGGKPEALLNEARNAADPGWSADGQSLVFGREPDLMGKESGSHTIQILELAKKTIQILPNSEGLFSPRWSPDGRWIAALSLDQKRLMLYDVEHKLWRVLASSSAADPVWSSDSRSIYVHAFLEDKQPILKVSVLDGTVHTVADLSSFRGGETADYFFGGLTPGNAPLVLPRVGTGNLYTLDLDRR